MLIRTCPTPAVDDPLNVVCDHYQSYGGVDCWLSWWQGSGERLRDGTMSIGIDNDMHEDTLRSYVSWLRELGFDARLCDHRECGCVQGYKYVPFGNAELVQHRWSIDMPYKAEDNAARTFVGWNLARFLIKEFTEYSGHQPRTKLYEPMTAEQYMTALFSIPPPNTNHMPFSEMYGYLYTRTYEKETEPRYMWNAMSGNHLYHYFTHVFAGNDWHNDTVAQRHTPHSYLDFGDFITWLSTHAILDTSI